MSFARRYWRKAEERNTKTPVSDTEIKCVRVGSYSSKFQCAIFYDIVETSQVAKKLREIMRPNPAKARPKKKGCVSVADAGDEVEFISEKVVAGIGCYASSAEGTLDYGRP